MATEKTIIEIAFSEGRKSVRKATIERNVKRRAARPEIPMQMRHSDKDFDRENKAHFYHFQCRCFDAFRDDHK